MYILDSNHLSLYQRGHESLRTYFATIPPEQIAITVISVEELIRGRLAQVRKATKPPERVSAYHWLLETLAFLCDFTVLEYDPAAEAHFQRLRDQKIRIGTQDLKIAAITLSQTATLVSRNQRDFAQISALNLEDWSSPKW